MSIPLRSIAFKKTFWSFPNKGDSSASRFREATAKDAQQRTETHLLETAVDRSDVWVHLRKDVLTAQLREEVGARKHLSRRAVWVMVESKDIYDAARAVRPRVLC
jgi:hypothetical protein